MIRYPHFNPRAHEGHDAHSTISPYEPTFQSTCPRGARRVCKGNTPPISRFQSTCPRGARPHAVVGRASKTISIHVPTRGTTWYRYVRGVRWLFQSTCPRGARLSTANLGSWFCAFQSTCPRGARLILVLYIHLYLDFNPRAHEGHDLCRLSCRYLDIFQSTCPRGARLCRCTHRF